MSTKDHRPDPDELLARVQQEEEQQTRGRLKIFFGATAGVGKTYAMLEAASELATKGVDVVAGIVETHGRAETDAMLQGLWLLPPRWVEYRGARLHEFDLDAALARRPTLILVDELAHSNAPGSRNAKRWQDVEELLGTGHGPSDAAMFPRPRSLPPRNMLQRATAGEASHTTRA